MPNCPYYDKHERMFVSCVVPGMDMHIITHFTKQSDREQQCRIYCDGGKQTQEYCEAYQIIAKMMHRPPMEPGKPQTVDEILFPVIMNRDGKQCKTRGKTGRRKTARPGARAGARAAQEDRAPAQPAEPERKTE